MQHANANIRHLAHGAAALLALLLAAAISILPLTSGQAHADEASPASASARWLWPLDAQVDVGFFIAVVDEDTASYPQNEEELQQILTGVYSPGIYIDDAFDASDFAAYGGDLYDQELYDLSGASINERILIFPTDDQIAAACTQEGIDFDPETQTVVWYVVKSALSTWDTVWHIDGLLVPKAIAPDPDEPVDPDPEPDPEPEPEPDPEPEPEPDPDPDPDDPDEPVEPEPEPDPDEPVEPEPEPDPEPDPDPDEPSNPDDPDTPAGPDPDDPTEPDDPEVPVDPEPEPDPDPVPDDPDDPQPDDPGSSEDPDDSVVPDDPDVPAEDPSPSDPDDPSAEDPGDTPIPGDEGSTAAGGQGGPSGGAAAEAPSQTQGGGIAGHASGQALTPLSTAPAAMNAPASAADEPSSVDEDGPATEVIEDVETPLQALSGLSDNVLSGGVAASQSSLSESASTALRVAGAVGLAGVAAGAVALNIAMAHAGNALSSLDSRLRDRGKGRRR